MDKLSERIYYDRGYIVLDIDFPKGFPESVTVDNQKLTLKSELHISLINAKKIAKLANPDSPNDTEKKIVDEFKDFIRLKPIEEYKLLGQYRLVQKDDRHSVIVEAQVRGLRDFFDVLNRKFAKNIPYQPTHATLYTLQPDRAIGLLTDEEVVRDSTPIQPEELPRKSFFTER